MNKYTIVKERIAKKEEVFDNLKNGGLKLLCKNLENNSISEVDWLPGGLIEIITIQNDIVIAQYTMAFPYHTVNQLDMHTSFFKNKIWYIGHIED